jgi:glycosyltransferase involved in cell wall biosynthesis
MVASFVEKKGHVDLIRAFAEVCKHDPECTLRLVGSGPLEGAVRALVQALGLDARVSFAGFVPHGAALLAEYREASVYVHPSRTAADGDQEGLPTTVLEAMAVGLPVVSTTHAGIPCAVSADSGLLVAEGDIDALGQALLHVLGDRCLRESMGAAGRSRILADFDLAVQTHRLECLYDEARGVSRREGAQ